MKRHFTRLALLWIGLILYAACGSPLPAALAQDQSVKPGINDSFQDPNVNQFVERFEREGREVYDLRKEIVEACEVRPGLVMADIGAGTGLFTRMFAEKIGAKGRVYAVDISEKFVKHVTKTSREAELENVVGVVCTATSANLPPASIDLAFICDTYHHFEFPQKTMATIHRALRPGGQLILLEFHRIEGKSSDWILGHVRAGQETFCAEVSEAGFKQTGEKRFMKTSYFVRFEKVEKSESAAAGK